MDRFTVLRNIGQGAQAVAYLAHYKSDPSRLVVLKRLSVGSVSSMEMGLMLRLRHPNIIRCYEAFTHQDFLILVLQYGEGGDMEMVINQTEKAKKTIPVDTIVSWFVQLASAVQYCHDLRIIHRDIKTSNIFLSKDLKTVFLGDFGVAKELVDGRSLTTTLVGSPLCLSPEVISGNPYSTPSDAWSLGCVLYELVALRRPFSSANFAQLVTRVCSAQFDPLPVGTPTYLADVIYGLLCLDTRERWTVMQAAGSDERLVKEKTRLESIGRAPTADAATRPVAAVGDGVTNVQISSPTVGFGGRDTGGDLAEWVSWKYREIANIQRQLAKIGSVPTAAPPPPPPMGPSGATPPAVGRRRPLDDTPEQSPNVFAAAPKPRTPELNAGRAKRMIGQPSDAVRNGGGGGRAGRSPSSEGGGCVDQHADATGEGHRRREAQRQDLRNRMREMREQNGASPSAALQDLVVVADRPPVGPRGAGPTGAVTARPPAPPDPPRHPTVTAPVVVPMQRPPVAAPENAAKGPRQDASPASSDDRAAKQREDFRAKIREQRLRQPQSMSDFSVEIVLPQNLKHLLKE